MQYLVTLYVRFCFCFDFENQKSFLHFFWKFCSRVGLMTKWQVLVYIARLNHQEVLVLLKRFGTIWEFGVLFWKTRVHKHLKIFRWLKEKTDLRKFQVVKSTLINIFFYLYRMLKCVHIVPIKYSIPYRCLRVGNSTIHTLNLLRLSTYIFMYNVFLRNFAVY